MKFKTAMNAINEVKFLVSGEAGSKYAGIYLKVDYLKSLEKEGREAFDRYLELREENPRVRWITYNKAVGMIEITLC